MNRFNPPPGTDPWRRLLQQADPDAAPTADDVSVTVGPAVRGRVRRQQRRRRAAATTLGLAVAASLVWVWPTAPGPGPPLAVIPPRDADADPVKRPTPVVTQADIEAVVREAAYARTLARALRESGEPETVRVPDLMPPLDDTAQLADLMLRLTEYETTLWLTPEAARARFARILQFFPHTPAAETLRQRQQTPRPDASREKESDHA